MVTFAPAASGARSFWIASGSSEGGTSSRSYVQSRPAARHAAACIAGLREYEIPWPRRKTFTASSYASPRGRGGGALPSHDFDLMPTMHGVLLEEGEQGRESGRHDLTQRILGDGR